MLYRFVTSPWPRNVCLAAGVALVWGAMMPAKAVDVSAVATTKRAAVVSVRPKTSGKEEAFPGQPGSLVVDVVGFEPPPTGSVQAVVTVKAASTGETHEIGRFGLFPNSSFKAKDADQIQKFRLTLNPTAAKLVEQHGKVSVDLLPNGGTGDGARLEIGKIDLTAK